MLTEIMKKILLHFIMGKYKWHITIITVIWGLIICLWLLLSFKDSGTTLGFIIFLGIFIGAIWNVNYAWPLGASINMNSNSFDVFARLIMILVLYSALIYLSIRAILEPLKISL